MKSRVFHGDLVVWAIFLFLIAISLIEVFSAGSYLAQKEGNFWSPFFRHFIYLVIAGIAAYVIHNIPCRFFKLIPIFFLPISLLLLFYVLFAGANLNSGARWISIFGITFQPSEIGKGTLVTTVALILSQKQREGGTDKNTIKIILTMTILICGLIVSQNFSTAALLFLIVYFMMFIGRVPLKQMGILTAIILGFGIFAVTLLKILPSDPKHSFYDSRMTQRIPTWRSRIFDDSFIKTPNPKDFVINDKNRQVVNARIALARSNGLGVGPGRSLQRNRLTHAYSDFIFAIIGEELGFGGVLFVVVLYLVLFLRTGRIASRCSNNFPAFLVMGLGIMLVSQAVLNMLVTVGIGPVTGQTLPLISKGGTSTVITGIYFGMILSISRSARRKDKTPLRFLANETNQQATLAFTKS